jgi:hypothetical protein
MAQINFGQHITNPASPVHQVNKVGEDALAADERRRKREEAERVKRALAKAIERAPDSIKPKGARMPRDYNRVIHNAITGHNDKRK